MILHRFMSLREFQKLMAGEVLTNNTDHSQTTTKTNSRGFCFTHEEPRDAIQWLGGNVDTQVCLTFSIKDDMVRETWGVYRDHNKDKSLSLNPDNIITKKHREYCCDRYCLDDIVLFNADFSYHFRYPGKAAIDKVFRNLGFAPKKTIDNES